MLGFDPRSFIIISAALSTLCAIVFAVLRRSFPTEIKGLKEWARAYFIMTAAAFLFALKGTLPLAFSSYLANILLVCGIMLMYAGMREFAGLSRLHRVLPLFLTVLSFALAGPTFFQDDYRFRVLLITGANAALFGMCAVVTWRMAEKRFPEWLTCVLFLFTGTVSLVRFVAALLQPAGNDSLNDVSALQHLYLGTFSFSLVALGVGFILMVNQRLRAMLEHAASHDDMTGAHRRTAFLDMLERELQGAPRGCHTSLLMIDIDDFKEINDSLGHIAGDQVIVDYAQKALGELRRADLFGRYGGEEFVVLLPDTTVEQACVIANRLRLATSKPSAQELPEYTVSVGVATSSGNEPCMNLVARADEALYEAKRAGKDRIAIAKGLESSVAVLFTHPGSASAGA